jgi:hypothetical protein
VNRIACLLPVVLATLACGAVNWSFDHDAGVDDAGALTIDASPKSDDDAEPGDTHESGAVHEAAVAPESGPAPDAGPNCTIDDDCPPSAPECTSDGRCVRCLSARDCNPDSGTPACNTMTGACVQCALTADCAGNAALPYCDTSANVCVRCLSNADCGFESLCLITTHTCTKMF